MIELSADVLAGKPYPSEHDDNEESLNKRLAQIEKKYDTSKRKYKKIMSLLKMLLMPVRRHKQKSTVNVKL